MIQTVEPLRFSLEDVLVEAMGEVSYEEESMGVGGPGSDLSMLDG
jgi:hypothetical protein